MHFSKSTKIIVLENVKHEIKNLIFINVDITTLGSDIYKYHDFDMLKKFDIFIIKTKYQHINSFSVWFYFPSLLLTIYNSISGYIFPPFFLTSIILFPVIFSLYSSNHP